MFDKLKAVFWSNRSNLERLLGAAFFAAVLGFFQYVQERDRPAS